jgi:TonB family protein
VVVHCRTSARKLGPETAEDRDQELRWIAQRPRRWNHSSSLRSVMLLVVALSLGACSSGMCSEGAILGPFPKTLPKPPPYPSDWRVRGFEGYVEVQAEIDSAGNVTHASIPARGNADTDKAALDNARLWKFGWSRDFRGFPRGGSQRLRVPFRHPRSPDLVPSDSRRSRAVGRTLDAQGRDETLAATVEASAFLDSVTGEFEYEYAVTNDSQSRAPLLYFALFPIQRTTCNDITGTGSELGWGGFQGCSGHIDVAGWMAKDLDPKADPRSHGLPRGETIAGLRFQSFDAPDRGRWIAGGGAGCGAACYPWADTCSIAETLAGTTWVPMVGGLGFRTAVSGEVVTDSALGPVPEANVEVLGTRLFAQTESNGHYTIRDVPCGRFRIRATAIGFQPAEEWVDLHVNGTYAMVLKMRRATAASR